MSASVVAGCDTAPILEAAEHVLDTMALAIERLSSGISIMALAGLLADVINLPGIVGAFLAGLSVNARAATLTIEGGWWDGDHHRD